MEKKEEAVRKEVAELLDDVADRIRSAGMPEAAKMHALMACARVAGVIAVQLARLVDVAAEAVAKMPGALS